VIARELKLADERVVVRGGGEHELLRFGNRGAVPNAEETVAHVVRMVEISVFVRTLHDAERKPRLDELFGERNARSVHALDRHANPRTGCLADAEHDGNRLIAGGELLGVHPEEDAVLFGALCDIAKGLLERFLIDLHPDARRLHRERDRALRKLPLQFAERGEVPLVFVEDAGQFAPLLYELAQDVARYAVAVRKEDRERAKRLRLGAARYVRTEDETHDAVDGRRLQEVEPGGEEEPFHSASPLSDVHELASSYSRIARLRKFAL